jgi:uncharacterized protein YuzE
MVKIYYDPEGDLLEIQFARTTKASRGIGLTDQITVFYDEDMEVLLGLTVTSYAKLLAHPRLPLTELLDAPESIQQKVRQSLQRLPLGRFLHLEGNVVELEDVRMSELVHP